MIDESMGASRMSSGVNHVGLVVLVLVTLLAVPRTWAGPGEGWISGRLTLHSAGGQVSLAEVAQYHDGKTVQLEFLRGRSVLVAEVDGDGYFIARGAPGSYRLEYLGVGEQAEFFKPLRLDLLEGVFSCVGTIQLEVESAQGLGQSKETPREIIPDCAQFATHLLERAGANVPVREAMLRTARHLDVAPTVTLRDILVGLRVQFALGTYSQIGGAYLLRLDNLVLLGEGGYVDPDDGLESWDAELGIGYNLLPILDGFVHAGARWPVSGERDPEAVLAMSVRSWNTIFGLGVRAELLPERSLVVTLDIAPLGLLGAFL